MSVKLLTEHHLEFLSLTGSSESTLVKMSHCWKSHAAAHLIIARDPLKFSRLRLVDVAVQTSLSTAW